MTTLDQVAEFHATFQHPILTAPEIPSQARCDLRTLLLAEELQELNDAIAEKDIVAVADAFADLQYVLSGAILEFGMKDKFPALFAEVHRSNMSKACKSQEEAEKTISWYEDQTGELCYWVERGGLFFVYRKSDDKTMKSINYSRADLFGILHGFDAKPEE